MKILVSPNFFILHYSWQKLGDTYRFWRHNSWILYLERRMIHKTKCIIHSRRKKLWVSSCICGHFSSQLVYGTEGERAMTVIWNGFLTEVNFCAMPIKDLMAPGNSLQPRALLGRKLMNGPPDRGFPLMKLVLRQTDWHHSLTLLPLVDMFSCSWTRTYLNLNDVCAAS